MISQRLHLLPNLMLLLLNQLQAFLGLVSHISLPPLQLKIPLIHVQLSVDSSVGVPPLGTTLLLELPLAGYSTLQLRLKVPLLPTRLPAVDSVEAPPLNAITLLLEQLLADHSALLLCLRVPLHLAVDLVLLLRLKTTLPPGQPVEFLVQNLSLLQLSQLLLEDFLGQGPCLKLTMLLAAHLTCRLIVFLEILLLLARLLLLKQAIRLVQLLQRTKRRLRRLFNTAAV
jgi:hypothetical protein